MIKAQTNKQNHYFSSLDYNNTVKTINTKEIISHTLKGNSGCL